MQPLVELAVVGLKARTVRLGMPQMQDPGGEASVLAAHAGADEANENIGILAAPSVEAGVEAVDLFEVGAPERHVAAAGTAPAARHQLAHEAEPKRDQRREAVEIAPRAMDHPARKAPQFRLQPLTEDAVGQFPRQQDAGAGDEPAGLGEAAMRRHEVAPRDAVAVEKYDVGAGAGANGAVADRRQPEAAILVPHMLDRDRLPGGPFAHDPRGRRGASVVGDHDLEIAVRLPRQRAQHRIESVLPIIGRDNDRDQFIHGGALPAKPSCNGSRFLPHWLPRAETLRGRRETRAARRSLAVIAEVKRTFPGKPIRYLVNTHNHFDHLGGVRTFVAEGATVITDDRSRNFYQRVVLAPQSRTLQPDRLSQRPFAPTGPGMLELQTFTDHYTISDGSETIELYHVEGFNHSDNMTIAYLPKEKIVVNADMYSPPAAGGNLPFVNNNAVVFYRNLKRLKLDVSQHV